MEVHWPERIVSCRATYIEQFTSAMVRDTMYYTDVHGLGSNVAHVGLPVVSRTKHGTVLPPKVSLVANNANCLELIRFKVRLSVNAGYKVQLLPRFLQQTSLSRSRAYGQLVVNRHGG